MMKFLISYLLARITLTLMSSSNYTGCFQKVNFTKSFILDVSLGSEYVSNYRFWMRLYYFFHFESIKFRSSRSQMSFKIEVFKNFAMFTGKHLYWSVLVTKLPAYKPANLLKRDSNTSAFLLILLNF